MPDYRDSFLEDAGAYFRKGNELAEQGRFKEACTSYRRAVELGHVDAAVYLNWGLTLGKLGEHIEAAEKFKQAATTGPEFALAYFNWAMALEKLRKPKEALEMYRRVCELTPKDAEAHYRCAILLTRLRRHEEALSEYKLAITHGSNEQDIYYRCGLAFAKCSRWKEAVDYYTDAAQRTQDNAGLYLEWGLALAELGKHRQAVGKFERAIEIAPRLAKAYYHHGESLFELGSEEEALEMFRRVTQLNPKHADAHYKCGLILQALDKHDEALQSFMTASEHGAECSVEYAEALCHNGFALLREARSTILAELEDMFGDEHDEETYKDVILRLARMYDGDAFELNDRGFPNKDFSSSPDRWDLAVSVVERYDRAIAMFKRATEANPSDGAAFAAWGEALRNLGREGWTIPIKKALELSYPGSDDEGDEFMDELARDMGYLDFEDAVETAASFTFGHEGTLRKGNGPWKRACKELASWWFDEEE